MKTPVIIITGYLGAGKTTFLRNIISQTDKRIAIIMNEFGEIGIDGQVVKGKNIDMLELSGGCVCCSLTGELEFAIKEVKEKTSPDLIIIETTGVAEPDAIVGDILENIEDVRLDAVVGIADANAIARFPSIGYTGRLQFEIADLIVINKIDLVNESQLNEVHQKIEEINPNAILIETIRGDVDLDQLFDIRREISLSHKEHKHVAESIQSFVFYTEKKLDKNRLEVLLSSLPHEIIRVKGLVRTNEGEFLLNSVFGRYEFEKNSARKTEIIFIGQDIGKYAGDMLKELAECEIE